MNYKKKILSKMLIFSVAILFTSCVNIFERVTFNKNGSGTYTFAVDLSGMANMYASMGMEMSGEELFNEMNIEEPAMIGKLTAIKGISNVRNEIDTTNITISINFDFDNIDALNEGISTYMHDSTAGPDVTIKTFYEQNGKMVVRSEENPILETFRNEITEEDLNNPMMKMMMGDMFYINQITMAKGISSFDNEEYTRIDDKTIEWKSNFFDSEKFKENISVSVKGGK